MQYQKFRANASGNNVIVTGEEGKIIQVYAIFFQCNSLATVKLRSGNNAAGDLTGPMSFSVGTGMNLPYAGIILFQTVMGEDLVMNVSGLGADVGGAVLVDVVNP